MENVRDILVMNKIDREKLEEVFTELSIEFFTGSNTDKKTGKKETVITMSNIACFFFSEEGKYMSCESFCLILPQIFG